MQGTYKLQQALEKTMYEGGRDRYHEQQAYAMEHGEGSNTKWNMNLSKKFIQPLAEGIRSYISQVEDNKRSKKAKRVVSHIALCPPEEAAYITIKSVLDAVTLREQTNTQYLSKEIAGKIEDQVKFSNMRESIKTMRRSKDPEVKKEGNRLNSYLNEVEKGLRKSNTRSYRHKKNVWSHVSNTLCVSEWQPWDDDDLKLLIGDVLLKLLVMVVEIHDKSTDTYEPVFEFRNVNIGKYGTVKTSRIITVTPKYLSYVAKFVENTEYLHPEVGPCVIQPRDWKTPFNGGFHSAKMASKNPLIKTGDIEHAKLMTKAQMPKVYKAVNILQRTKWKVNTDVLDTLQEVLKRGKRLAIPSLSEEAKPLNPLKMLPNYDEIAKIRGKELEKAIGGFEYKKFQNWKKEVRKWNDKERSRTSKVLELLATKKMAEKYAGYDFIHFVYSLDFRSRFYVRSNGLSPQGGDLQKSLLSFANNRELGAYGDYWLYLKGANLWGVKGGLDELIGYFKESPERLQMVKDIAKDAVSNIQWTKADKPWQFLSWCFVMSDLLDWLDSGKSLKDFKSGTICSMDGTCSGLQHYSAMLLDPVGGLAVNLINDDLPHDIYAEVALATEKNIRKTPVSRAMAQYWLKSGILGRGICKTSVMTLPYSSTYITCRDSVEEYMDKLIEKELEEAEAEGRAATDVLKLSKFGVDREEAEKYISKKIWESIGDVVISAKLGMAAIKQITRKCVENGEPLIYENCVGFLMKQEIYETEKRTVNTTLLGRVQYKVYVDTDDISLAKMLSSCCPNIIHCQDSAHLVLVVCDCNNKGITDIYVVHDDYGTHAIQCGILSKSLRICFVFMYSYDVLEDLLYQQEERLKKDLEIELPKRGSLDINEVLTSKYIFM